jgi:hypothetical protein
VAHTFDTFIRNHPHHDVYHITDFRHFDGRIAFLDALLYALCHVCAHICRSKKVGPEFRFTLTQKILNVPQRPEDAPDPPFRAVVANSARHMIVSAHAGYKDNVLAVRLVSSREVFEIPYCRVCGVVDCVIVDVNNFLRRWGWGIRLWLATVILGAIEPVMESRGRDAGIGDYNVHSVGRRKGQRGLKDLCDVFPRCDITLNKLSTFSLSVPCRAFYTSLFYDG